MPLKKAILSFIHGMLNTIFFELVQTSKSKIGPKISELNTVSIMQTQ